MGDLRHGAQKHCCWSGRRRNFASRYMARTAVYPEETAINACDAGSYVVPMRVAGSERSVTDGGGGSRAGVDMAACAEARPCGRHASGDGDRRLQRSHSSIQGAREEQCRFGALVLWCCGALARRAITLHGPQGSKRACGGVGSLRIATHACRDDYITRSQPFDQKRQE